MFGNGMDTSAHQFGGSFAGGFMPASPAGGTQTTPSSAQRSRRPDFDSQCLMPLSIKQILNMDEPGHDQTYRIDGKELYHVTIVGWVEEMDAQTTHTSFKIRDESGVMTVKMWNSDADRYRTEKIGQIQLRQWVRVIGRIQSFQQQFSLTGFDIRPIEDFNEITYHLLEVIHAHLENTNRAAGFGTKQGRPQMPNFNDVDVTITDSVGGHGMGMAVAGDPGFGNDSTSDPTQAMILNLMADPRYVAAQEGVHVDHIFSAFPNVERNKIRQAMEELANEGMVYSTVDEEHFKATTN